jgi:multiple sugar transport system permease protein
MKKRISKVTPYLYIAPHLTLFIVFFMIPALYGIFISFTKWDLFGEPLFVGLDNYKTILFDKDSTFYLQLRIGLSNTFKFVIFSVPFCIAMPLLMAVAIKAKPFGSRLFQAILYLPSLFSISAVVLSWQFMFHKSLGPINNILNLKINWFGEQPYAWFTLVVITVWWFIGANMIIYLAALSGIDQTLYEAAKVDGASIFRQFIHVTIPGIIYPLAYTIVLTTIAQFNVYGQPFMLTAGGPSNSTRVLLMYIRENAFGTGGSIAGISSAMALILGVCIMIVSIFQLLILRVDK